MERRRIAALMVVGALAGGACSGAGAAPIETRESPPSSMPAQPALSDVTLVDDTGDVAAVRGGTVGAPVDGIVGMDDRTVVSVEHDSLVWRDGVDGPVTFAGWPPR